jgi:hypothetical protein
MKLDLHFRHALGHLSAYLIAGSETPQSFGLRIFKLSNGLTGRAPGHITLPRDDSCPLSAVVCSADTARGGRDFLVDTLPEEECHMREHNNICETAGETQIRIFLRRLIYGRIL